MTKFMRRFLGAMALLPYVYEEIEADRRALPQALAVVMLSSLASGAAYWVDFGAAGVAAGVTATLLGWLVWTWLVYHIGTRWLPGEATQADWGETCCAPRDSRPRPACCAFSRCFRKRGMKFFGLRRAEKSR